VNSPCGRGDCKVAEASSEVPLHDNGPQTVAGGDPTSLLQVGEQDRGSEGPG
jgi:hypothetical protein